MAIKYLDAAKVLAVKQTEPRPNKYRSGYGSRIPACWMMQLRDKHWRRVYCICWSNIASYYIEVKGKRIFLAGTNPMDYAPKTQWVETTKQYPQESGFYVVKKRGIPTPAILDWPGYKPASWERVTDWFPVPIRKADIPKEDRFALVKQ